VHSQSTENVMQSFHAATLRKHNPVNPATLSATKMVVVLDSY